jgi:hypothetical protein
VEPWIEQLGVPKLGDHHLVTIADEPAATAVSAAAAAGAAVTAIWTFATRVVTYHRFVPVSIVV